jgi:hypothetical protein
MIIMRPGAGAVKILPLSTIAYEMIELVDVRPRAA